MSRETARTLGLALLIGVCGVVGVANAEKPAEAPVALTVAEYVATPEKWVDKTVEIKGTVSHVCKHGGTKMFVMGEKPEDVVKVEKGQVSPFTLELEGSDVKVVAVGRVLKVDEAYLDNWEAESTVEETGNESAGGSAADHHSEAKEQIEGLRKELASCAMDYLGFYHLECVSYVELGE